MELSRKRCWHRLPSFRFSVKWDIEKQVSKSKKSPMPLTHAVWAPVAWTALRLDIVLPTDVTASRERQRVLPDLEDVPCRGWRKHKPRIRATRLTLGSGVSPDFYLGFSLHLPIFKKLEIEYILLSRENKTSSWLTFNCMKWMKKVRVQCNWRRATYSDVRGEVSR